jgi:NAD-reducing hydrogenase small subunit
MARLKLATTWLGGCSGCHMSFLDLDEWLLELATRADLVYSPIIDTKEFPEGVDVTLIEGAVANEDHEHHIRLIRERSRVLVSFGDCAVTGNVTAVRNNIGTAENVLRRSYLELVTVHPAIPADAGVLPPLVDKVRPVHQVVPVEYYLPGCPPPANHIRAVLEALLAGEEPHLEGRQIKFG